MDRDRAFALVRRRRGRFTARDLHDRELVAAAEWFVLLGNQGQHRFVASLGKYVEQGHGLTAAQLAGVLNILAEDACAADRVAQGKSPTPGLRERLGR